MLSDADLTLNEKRAILASWASDACAVEAAPDLRSNARGVPVLFDDIMEALRTVDRKANGHRYRRVLHHRRGLLRRHPTPAKVVRTALQDASSELVGSIDIDREHANLSSAIRLFVIDHYQARAAGSW